MTHIVETELLETIEAFLAESGMSATAFGNKAAGDPRLIPDIKKSGRELRRQLRARVLAFIAEQSCLSKPSKRKRAQ